MIKVGQFELTNSEVRAPTRMPRRRNCPAILAVVWCVHRRLLIGSPTVWCSNSVSI
jgi:hypothetical protein